MDLPHSQSNLSLEFLSRFTHSLKPPTSTSQNSNRPLQMNDESIPFQIDPQLPISVSMDLPHPRPNLSPEFLSRFTHYLPPPTSTLQNTNRPLQLNDESIPFQIDPQLRQNSSRLSSIPLQLLDESDRNCRSEGGFDDAGDSEASTEEFRVLGHTTCLKRNLDSLNGPDVDMPEWMIRSAGIGISRCSGVESWGNQSLMVADPEIFGIIEKEKMRQFKGIELIVAENFVCRAVMEALGSPLTNKDSQGMPGARSYGGNQYIDEIETLCCQRALAAFELDPENWGVNVQPYSCTSANFAVYTALLLPGDRILGMDTRSGGFASHGCYTLTGRKASGASIFFQSLSYKVNPRTGYVDYEKLEERAVDYHPKILICGGSSYPREWDYAKLRQIADKCGAVLMCDMAQNSGLIAAKESVSPFDFCDIVTSTTHKSLRGPRGGIIFYRKGKNRKKRSTPITAFEDREWDDFGDKINFAVFPALQDGPHNNHIAAVAIALKQVSTPEYKAYMKQTKKNAQHLASALVRRNCKLVTGGTDNNMLLWDLRPCGITGKNFEKVCEMCHMTLNKVMLCGDNGAMSSGGARIGTPAMTTRGCVGSDFETIADFLIRAAKITYALQREHGKTGFLKALECNKDAVELRSQVEAFGAQFPLPGLDHVNLK